MPSSDPHGHHDWHSHAYVDEWISTDATRDVAHACDDPRITVHAFPERQGLAGNWNRTLALARGEVG